MNRTKRLKFEKLLEDKYRRLDLYREKETSLLKNEAQSYSLGSRSKTKYNITLGELRKAIQQLEEEISELENILNASGSRKAVSIIPAF